MNIRAVLKLGSLALLAVAATGCDRVTNVTFYEPGVFKGATDPLLKLHATAEHKAQLRERFSKGQADR